MVRGRTRKLDQRQQQAESLFATAEEANCARRFITCSLL
jgi:hypothetical protein